MTSDLLTVRNKLKGKRIVSVGAIAALPFLLLSRLSWLGNVFICDEYFHASTFFGSWLKYNDEGVRFYFRSLDEVAWYLISLLPSVLSTILLLAAIALLIVYVVRGHKASRGTVLLALVFVGITLSRLISTATLLPSAFDFLKALSYNEVFKSDFINGGEGVFENLLIVLWHAIWELRSLLFAALITVAFAVATIGWFINPKFGKTASVVAAVATILLMLIESGYFWINQIGILLDELYFTSAFITCFNRDVWSLLLYSAMLVLLIANRFPPVFAKKQPIVEEIAQDAVEEIVEDAVEGISDEPAVDDEESPAREPAVSSSAYSDTDEKLYSLFELRTNGEISSEEYRKLRDMVHEKQ